MEFLQKIFKDKNFRNLFFVILGIIGIILFPPLWILFLTVTVIAMMYAAVNKDLKNQDSNEGKSKEIKYVDPDLEELRNITEELQEIDVEKDYSKLKNITDRIPSLMEDVMTPKTFYEIVGDLTLKTTHYYFEDLEKQDKNAKKYPSLESDFQKAKDVCDGFFDGNEYVKVWVIYRSLLQKQVPEEKINKNFPELISTLKDIRDQKWKDVAWAYHIADEVEKISGKDSCSKERYKNQEAIFAEDDSKEKMTENQDDEFKQDYKLLLAFDPDEMDAKDKEISEQLLKNFDVENFGGKPNKINSDVLWDIDDAIKFGEKVREEFLDLPMLNGLGFDTSEQQQKLLQFAGSIRTEDHYANIFDDKFVDQIQDIDRISDFYQFEMFDKDPIKTSIENEDIERIIFHSLLQIPKKTILNADIASKDDPLKRAPWFGIMQIHLLIILQVLQDLGIYNKNEIVIASWITNQFVDPLDGGDAMNKILKTPNTGRYDDKFMKEIWVPLYFLLRMEFNFSKESYDSTRVVDVAGSTFYSVLKSYFIGDPEEAYTMMRPMYDLLQEREKK